MRLSKPQMRALKEIASGRVKQDRVARYFIDGEHDKMRERSIRSVIYKGLAVHRAAAVKTRMRFLPIELTDRGHEIWVQEQER